MTNIPKDEDDTFLSGFVAILGCPNVGKSTLLNRILEHKIAIVTPKPQTTRTRILGILHNPRYQIVFVDTPGIHTPIHRLGEILVANAVRAISDSDVNLVLIDASKNLTEEDAIVLETVFRKSKAPIIVVLNKMDAAKTIDLNRMSEEISAICKPDKIISISALTGENVDKLLENIVSFLPPGPPFFDKDTITDQRTDETVAEIIREKLIMAVRQEVPYHTAVMVENIAPAEKNRDVLHIRAIIFVARKGQKALVIGKAGSRIKTVGIAARTELEKLFGQKVFLELWVKVRPDWFKKDSVIGELGYKR